MLILSGSEMFSVAREGLSGKAEKEQQYVLGRYGIRPLLWPSEFLQYIQHREILTAFFFFLFVAV